MVVFNYIIERGNSVYELNTISRVGRDNGNEMDIVYHVYKTSKMNKCKKRKENVNS